MSSVGKEVTHTASTDSHTALLLRAAMQSLWRSLELLIKLNIAQPPSGSLLKRNERVIPQKDFLWMVIAALLLPIQTRESPDVPI